MAQTIRGFVCPIAWGADSTPTEVSVCTNDDDEFLVDPPDDPTEESLLDHADEDVEVTGEVYMQAGQQRLRVTSFTVLEDEYDADEPEDPADA